MMDGSANTKELLLTSARDEFLKNGYEKASLRTICKNAGLTTGALYFFFKNKEYLFDSLVKNVSVNFKNIINTYAKIEKEEYQKSLSIGQPYSISSDVEHEKEFMKYIYANKTAFILLAFRAQGSSYENYYHEITNLIEGKFYDFLNLYQDRSHSHITRFTIHCLVSWRIRSYLDILNSELTIEEALAQTEVVANFAVGGWNRIIETLT
ncbi:MAG: TetR/AcrR family transcriptional regulator [Ethanoligenens sp.]